MAFNCFFVNPFFLPIPVFISNRPFPNGYCDSLITPALLASFIKVRIFLMCIPIVEILLVFDQSLSHFCNHSTVTALNLPPTAPWWMCVLGSVFAILVVKQLFGGLGQNFMNPALGARCFLLISFTGRMTTFVYDGVSGATPLAQLKAGESVNTFDMLIGNTAGTIGETSVIAIMIGAIFLLLMGVIDLRIPGTYIVTFVIFIILFGGHGLDPQYITAHLCGGGLMLGAWFMATDYVTSPITKKGQIVYGVCLGLLTGLFRLFGGSAEGVSYAIIFSNLLVPLIEKVTLPKPFGKGGEKD